MHGVVNVLTSIFILCNGWNQNCEISQQFSIETILTVRVLIEAVCMKQPLYPFAYSISHCSLTCTMTLMSKYMHKVNINLQKSDRQRE